LMIERACSALLAVGHAGRTPRWLAFRRRRWSSRGDSHSPMVGEFARAVKPLGLVCRRAGHALSVVAEAAEAYGSQSWLITSTSSLMGRLAPKATASSRSRTTSDAASGTVYGSSAM